MIALNLNIPILDGATGAAQLLELLCQRGQLCLACHHPIYNRYRFSSTPLTVTHHAHNAIALFLPLPLRAALLIAATVFIG